MSKINLINISDISNKKVKELLNKYYSGMQIIIKETADDELDDILDYERTILKYLNRHNDGIHMNYDLQDVETMIRFIGVKHTSYIKDLLNRYRMDELEDIVMKGYENMIFDYVYGELHTNFSKDEFDLFCDTVVGFMTTYYKMHKLDKNIKVGWNNIIERFIKEFDDLEDLWCLKDYTINIKLPGYEFNIERNTNIVYNHKFDLKYHTTVLKRLEQIY